MIGSSAQNNPKAQQNAHSFGAVSKIVELLRNSNDRTTRKRAMFALSALVRNCEAGYSELKSNEGVSALANALARDSKDSTATKRKVAVLFSDLLEEQAATLYTVSGQ